MSERDDLGSDLPSDMVAHTYYYFDSNGNKKSQSCECPVNTDHGPALDG